MAKPVELSDEKAKQLVLTYLRNRGWEKTATEFQKESKVRELPDKAFHDQAIQDASLESQILRYNIADLQPSKYDECVHGPDPEGGGAGRVQVLRAVELAGTTALCATGRTARSTISRASFAQSYTRFASPTIDHPTPVPLLSSASCACVVLGPFRSRVVAMQSRAEAHRNLPLAVRFSYISFWSSSTRSITQTPSPSCRQLPSRGCDRPAIPSHGEGLWGGSGTARSAQW